MTESQAREITERALSYGASDDMVVVLSQSDEASTRFANNSITQNVAKSNLSVTVRAAYGNRVGAARTNLIEGSGLRDAVARAESIARMAAPDTEHMPPVPPCSYVKVDAWDQSTADCSPESRAHVIRDAVELAVSEGLNSAGSYATDSDAVAVANNRGLFAYHRATAARFVMTVMTPSSSGWAQASSFRADELDATAAAARAVAKAKAAANPTEAPARPTRVVLEPAAVAEFLAFMMWSMDAKAADEGRSAFAGKVGERIGSEMVDLHSRPDDPQCPATPFADDGMPVPSVNWIERGVVRNLAHSRYWAHKSGRPYTGRPANLLMTGGESTLDELIAGTDDGLLVTRFWYIRFVDPMKLLLTGMTRDGLYHIRDGKIVSGVKNLRFNESPLRVLQCIEGLTQAETLGGYLPAKVPAVKAAAFTFTSGTAF